MKTKRAGFDTLVARYYPAVYSFASRRCNPSGFCCCSNRASRYSLISGEMARLILSCEETSDRDPGAKHKPSNECMKTLLQGTHTAPPAVGRKGERVHIGPEYLNVFLSH
jgi:hypothetical protein